MEWFWVSVVYLWLAAMGALVVLVLYRWLKAASEREKAPSRTAVPAAATTERVDRRQAVA